MSQQSEKARQQMVEETGHNRAIEALLHIASGGSSVLAARTNMSAAGWSGLWPEWVAGAKPGDALTSELLQRWLRHLLGLEGTSATASELAIGQPICRRCASYATLTRSLESQLSVHRSKALQYTEATNTLASERAANAQLTEELAKFQARADAGDIARYDIEGTGEPYAAAQGEYMLAADVLPAMARQSIRDEETLVDAMHWRALLASARIRTIGSAGIVSPEPGNYAHLSLELWTRYGTPEEKLDFSSRNAVAKDWLIKYAGIAAAAQCLNAGMQR
jgi:hypothetical protein